MSVSKHRDGWQASVSLGHGKRQKKNFKTKAEANAWVTEMKYELLHAHAPLLGGPSKVTLAGALFKYAHQFTIIKKGRDEELNRINRYLSAAQLPILKAIENAKGGFEIIEIEGSIAQALPSKFSPKREAELEARAKTNKMREELACMPVSRISKAILRDFLTLMETEGLAGSTALKEAALLKALFNKAKDEWNWTNFKNPFDGMDMPEPGPGRDRVFNQDEKARLVSALQKCDNPYIMPLFELSLLSLGRISSMLKLTWENVHLDKRQLIFLNTKSGKNVRVTLTKRAVEFLSCLPRDPNEPRVFPITESAVRSAWKRVKQRAQIDNLHWHDLRHVGASDMAERTNDATMVQIQGGWTNLSAAQVYMHTNHDKMIAALDATEPEYDYHPTDLSGTSAAKAFGGKKAQRLNMPKAKEVPLPVVTPSWTNKPSVTFKFKASPQEFFVKKNNYSAE